MSRFRRLICLFMVVALVGFTLGMGSGGEQEGNKEKEWETPPRERTLTIIHTNDIHGQVVEKEAEWVESRPMVGGIARLASFLEKERAMATQEDRTMIYIDAADWFSGSPESDLLDGWPMVVGLNEVGMDYTTIGNHDIDHGVNTLKESVQAFDGEVIVSNLKYRGDDGELGQFPGTVSTAVRNHDGIRIGFFGLVAESTPRFALPKNVEGMEFQDQIESARQAVRELRGKNPDLIVGISHVGKENDVELAQEVDGIDVLVGGHSHDRILDPRKENGTLIVQAGSSGENVGRLDLTLSVPDHSIKRASGGLVTLYEDRYSKDQEVLGRLQQEIDKIDQDLDEVVGRSTELLRRYGDGVYPLGYIVTDAMRESADADMAVHNLSGVRADLPAGEIRWRDVHQVQPFGNYLISMELTGEQIRRFAEGELAYPDSQKLISGMEVRMDLDRPQGERVREIRIDGEALDPNRTYELVTTNFLVDTADREAVLARGKNLNRLKDMTLRDLLIDYIRDNSPISPIREPRWVPVQQDARLIPTVSNLPKAA